MRAFGRCRPTIIRPGAERRASTWLTRWLGDAEDAPDVSHRDDVRCSMACRLIGARHVPSCRHVVLRGMRCNGRRLRCQGPSRPDGTRIRRVAATIETRPPRSPTLLRRGSLRRGRSRAPTRLSTWRHLSNTDMRKIAGWCRRRSPASTARRWAAPGRWVLNTADHWSSRASIRSSPSVHPSTAAMRPRHHTDGQ